MLFNIKTLSNVLFKPVQKRIWARTGNWVDYRRDIVIFKVLFLALFAIVIANATYYSQGLMLNFYIGIIQFAIVVFCMYLIYIGRDLWAKNISLLFINATFFISVSMLGRGIPSYIYFIPIIAAVLFYYNSSQVKHTIFMLVLTFLSLLVLEFTNYSLFGNLSATLPPQSKIFTVVIPLILSLSIGAVMVREHVIMNKYNRMKLKRLNQNLKNRNKKLKKTNKELDSFVYRSSHDLRSPLTSIMGIINIIKAEDDIHKIQEYVNFQERSVKKLDSLVQDILDISRNSRMEVEASLVELKAFMLECIESLSYMEEFNKVKIVVDIPATFICISDMNRLRVVFVNILSNALRYSDFSKDAPAITVSLLTFNEEGIHIIFEDNGTGIKLMHLNKTFEMFYRGTDRNNGSGLGLYIVRELISKIGGAVNITSVYGKGTSVIVSFPNLKIQQEGSNDLVAHYLSNN